MDFRVEIYNILTFDQTLMSDREKLDEILKYAHKKCRIFSHFVETVLKIWQLKIFSVGFLSAFHLISSRDFLYFILNQSFR